MSLALFDLDNTLIAGDSDHGWGEFLVEKALVDPVYYKEQNDRFYADYEAGALDIQAYLKFSLEPLTRFDAAALAQLHREFMDAKIAPLRLPRAEALLAEHRARGDYLVVITSTNGFITEPIARELGVDDILATNAEKVDGRYTGELLGTPCYQEGKVTRLNAWLKTYPGDMRGSYFYSDSINDAPLLGKTSAEQLQQADFKVSWHPYPLQHGVSMDELEDIKQFILKL